MTINFEERLANLKLRRQLPDGLREIAKAEHFASPLGYRPHAIEQYETRGTTTVVKYALGCMQEVSPTATAVSVEEGERVRGQLKSGLDEVGVKVSFEYQGSVPLNVHIRASSDIDLLVLRGDILTVDFSGPRGAYYQRTTLSAAEKVLDLRNRCEGILRTKFPAVTVDDSGAKSIALTGGSLRRKVDVVPSVWHDGAAYQASQLKHDRVVKVLDKTKMELFANFPFLHMKRIEDKDKTTLGGAKKAIRLLKSLKRDTNPNLELSSYEIAGLVWHIDDQLLALPASQDLGLIASLQTHLRKLEANPAWAMSLRTPDDSREILNAPGKFKAMVSLRVQVDDLAVAVVQGINPSLGYTIESVQRVIYGARV